MLAESGDPASSHTNRMLAEYLDFEWEFGWCREGELNPHEG
jgi:hypothetical protein